MAMGRAPFDPDYLMMMRRYLQGGEQQIAQPQGAPQQMPPGGMAGQAPPGSGGGLSDMIGRLRGGGPGAVNGISPNGMINRAMGSGGGQPAPGGPSVMQAGSQFMPRALAMLMGNGSGATAQPAPPQNPLTNPEDPMNPGAYQGMQPGPQTGRDQPGSASGSVTASMRQPPAPVPVPQPRPQNIPVPQPRPPGLLGGNPNPVYSAGGGDTGNPMIGYLDPATGMWVQG